MNITAIARTAFGQVPAFAGKLSAALAGAALMVSPVLAQDMETFDPDEVYAGSQSDSAAGGIDGDLTQPRSTQDPAAAPSIDGPAAEQPSFPYEAVEPDSERVFDDKFEIYADEATDDAASVTGAEADADGDTVASAEADAQTYGEDDLIGAAEGVFGKGAEGLARMIEDLLKKQGQPNGYIVGREAGGAFIIGARYGSGTLFHKVEGERKVYWTGPSIGLDAGANAANTFVLVYNLFDTEDLFERFPAGEGQAYLIGGVHASYMRRGDIVLIPIRMGAGVRLGINAGYMKFSKKQRWSPF